MNLKSITVHLFHCPSDWTLPLLPGKWLSLCGCSHGSVHAEILAMKKEEVEKQKLLDEATAQKLAEENLIAQANPELQELSNSQDSKISDSYIYYETVD